MKPVTLQDCADEPITIPGSIQNHGLLFALNSRTLEIEQASSNTEALLGISSEDLLGTSILNLVEVENQERLRSLIAEAAENYVNPFVVELINSEGDQLRCNGLAQTGGEDISILELEPLDLESPLDDNLENYFQLVQNSFLLTSKLWDAGEIAGLMAEKVKKFTGFDRVMIYRFAGDYSGEVIGEAVESDMESFLHLRYPASDIPEQARALYLVNWVRLLRDTEAEVVPILPVKHPRLNAPTPLSKSALRSMSPIHLQYLRNMGVRATLTISLIVDGKLWGLIACHHRAPKFVSYGIRATSSLYGVVMSAELARAENGRKMSEQNACEQGLVRLFSRLDPLENLEQSFSKSLPLLLKIFNADGAAFVSKEKSLAHGSSPSIPELRPLTEELSRLNSDQIFITDKAREDYPNTEAYGPMVAGMVAIPLGLHSWLLIFRDEQILTIRWGGNPNEEKIRDELGRLTPRESFNEYVEQIKGRSVAWPDYTAQLVDELRSGLSGFVISKNRVLEVSNEELQNFASVIAHEVKSQIQPPLMALMMVKEKCEDEKMDVLINLGTDALSTLSEFTTEMSEFSHMDVDVSSMSQTDLSEVARLAVDQAIESLSADHVSAKICNLPLRNVSRSQSHHMFSNLIRNALIHGPAEDQKDFQLEIGCQEADSNLIFYVRDNGRGIPECEQERIFEYFYRGTGSSERKGSGIGLGFTKRLLERTGDRIWVESSPGEGSVFFFTLGEEKQPSNGDGLRKS